MTALTELADERFLSLTTFRKSGERVHTPVWVTPDGDGLIVTTDISTGKVKRLRNDSRVELRPSTMSGKVRDDAALVSGVAEIITDSAEQHKLRKLIAKKYGLQYTVLMAVARNKERCILRITAG